MQNHFQPEETPEYRTFAPIAQQTEAAPETERAAERAPSPARQAAHLERLKQRYRRRRNEFGPGLTAFAILTFFSLLAARSWLPFAPMVNLLLTLTLIGVYVGGGGYWIKCRRPFMQQHDAAQMGGTETIGPLLDMLGGATYDRDTHALRDALAPRLLELDADGAAALTFSQRDTLARQLRLLALTALNLPAQPDFCVAALHALTQIGDAKSVPLAEKIANMRTPTADKARIWEAARECLPLLQIRAGLVAQSKTLLRASTSAKAERDTLLRAASGADETKPEELLRPSDGNGAAGGP